MKVLVAVFCFNEHLKIERTLSRFPRDATYDLVVMNDGSTDDSAGRIRTFPGVELVSHPTNLGVGASMRTVNRYALERGYEVIVHVAGNDKDDPQLIPCLLQPILAHGFDYVQGSRYLTGGRSSGMPLHRLLATRYVHPLLFFLATRRWVTDSTNGFRAFRTSLLLDPRIRLDQAWLDRYGLEPYFFCKVVQLRYKVTEVPVTKHYPSKSVGYTKIRPFVDWWAMVRPLIYLALGIRR